MWQIIGHHETHCTQPAAQCQHVRQFSDVALHRYKDYPQFGMGRIRKLAGAAKRHQIFNDLRQFGTYTDICETLRISPIDGDPQGIQPGGDQILRPLDGQQRSIGYHLCPSAQILHSCNHVHNPWMSQWLADAAKKHRWRW